MTRSMGDGLVSRDSESMTAPGASAVFAKISWRLVPLMIWMMVLATMDRQNVGYAKLSMLADLRFSETVFGIGAGIFFVGYAIFGIPVSLILKRVGVRRMLGGVTLLWGLTSLSNAWVTTAAQFYAVRFFMGVCEAGLLPCFLFYTSQWYPTSKRGAVIAAIAAGSPIAAIVGAPVSGYILSYFDNVAGHDNWQWLFVLEAVPSILTGIWCYCYLPESPAGSRWLSTPEKRMLAAELTTDLAQNPPLESSFRSSLRSRIVWRLSAINFCLLFGSTALQFWTPTIIRQMGIGDPLAIGLIASAMSVVGICSMVLFGRRSDRRNERRKHAAFAFGLSAVGLVVTGALLSSPLLAIAALTIATAATFSAYGPYWAIPSSLLSGTDAVASLALISSLGVTAGFIAQAAIGWSIDWSGTIAAGLYLTGGAMVAGAALVLGLRLNRI